MLEELTLHPFAKPVIYLFIYTVRSCTTFTSLSYHAIDQMLVKQETQIIHISNKALISHNKLTHVIRIKLNTVHVH